MSGNRVNRTARTFSVETEASGNPGKAQKQDGLVTSGKRTGMRSSESLSCSGWAPPQLATGSLISGKMEPESLLIG